jgi:hypothetical protein
VESQKLPSGGSTMAVKKAVKKATKRTAKPNAKSVKGDKNVSLASMKWNLKI